MDKSAIKVTINRLDRSDDYIEGFGDGAMRGVDAACEEAAKEIVWYRSSLVALMTLAETGNEKLTHARIAEICKTSLERFAS